LVSLTLFNIAASYLNTGSFKISCLSSFCKVSVLAFLRFSKASYSNFILSAWFILALSITGLSSFFSSSLLDPDSPDVALVGLAALAISSSFYFIILSISGLQSIFYILSVKYIYFSSFIPE